MTIDIDGIVKDYMFFCHSSLKMPKSQISGTIPAIQNIFLQKKFLSFYTSISGNFVFFNPTYCALGRWSEKSVVRSPSSSDPSLHCIHLCRGISGSNFSQKPKSLWWSCKEELAEACLSISNVLLLIWWTGTILCQLYKASHIAQSRPFTTNDNNGCKALSKPSMMLY